MNNTITLKPDAKRQAEIDRLNDELGNAYHALLDVIASPAFANIDSESITGRYLQTLMRINDPFQLETFCAATTARQEALQGMEALSEHAAALATAMRHVIERASQPVPTTYSRGSK